MPYEHTNRSNFRDVSCYKDDISKLWFEGSDKNINLVPYKTESKLAGIQLTEGKWYVSLRGTDIFML